MYWFGGNMARLFKRFAGSLNSGDWKKKKATREHLTTTGSSTTAALSHQLKLALIYLMSLKKKQSELNNTT